MTGSECRSVASERTMRVSVGPTTAFRLRWLVAVLAFLGLPAIAVAAPCPARLLERLVAPFRSHAFLENRTTPCGLGASCFRSNPSSRQGPKISEPELVPAIEDPSRVVDLQLRALHGGPLAHHW